MRNVVSTNIGLALLLAAQGIGMMLTVSASEPIPLQRAHAHNDYAHPRPLFDALDCGFCSIEADIHLVDGQLLVAHDRVFARSDRTLGSLYLEPLRRRITENGGRVYRNGPTCILLIDIKSGAETTYSVLHKQLEQYADILTTFKNEKVYTNALTVIISGNCPRNLIAAQPVRYAACDGREPDFDSDVSTALVPLISERWGKLFKWRGRGSIPMPESEYTLLTNLVKRAHARGRLIRFWDTPDNPEAWQVLYETGVDLLNTDHLKALRDFLYAKIRLIDAQPR